MLARTPSTVLGDPAVGAGVPIVASFDAKRSCFSPTALLIGIAPIGGELPEVLARSMLVRVMEAGLKSSAGCTTSSGKTRNWRRSRMSTGARIWDVRRPPADLAMRIRQGTPHRAGSHVVSFCGTDCNVGKMTVCIELDRAAQRRGLSSVFAATGQTGMMISGSGIPADRFISDFVLAPSRGWCWVSPSSYDWVFVEGQGSLCHPAYSAVTLGLLHGAAPDC